MLPSAQAPGGAASGAHLKARWYAAVGAAIGLLLTHASGAEPTAESLYKAKCSVCHDGGAGDAPRISDRSAWVARAAQGRASLYARTINGVPNTPMAPKGGFAELSDAQIRTLVDFMLAASGHAAAPLGGRHVAAPALAPPASAAPVVSPGMPGVAASATDAGITAAVAERLRAALGKPDMRLDLYEGIITIRGLGIKVDTRDGATTLSGVVQDAGLLAPAESIAGGVPGVKRIINRLISGAMLDFD